MASRGRAALGFTTHIGRAVVVAVGGPIDAPEILAKTRIDVATTFDEGAVFEGALRSGLGRNASQPTRSPSKSPPRSGSSKRQ